MLNFNSEVEAVDFAKTATKILNKLITRENVIITLPHIKKVLYEII